jgi:hypothetical protein
MPNAKNTLLFLEYILELILEKPVERDGSPPPKRIFND